jgi:glycosyltransferase involved in cell wall biosynthesis
LNILPTNGPLISAIVIAYDRPEMIRHALRALLDQTYRDLEIIVVLNGATEEVRHVVGEFQAMASNIEAVFFPVNIYDLDDFTLQLRRVYRAGFEASSGEFVFIQSDDDFVATDFFARMARLFMENPACTTAIGLPQSYYWADGSTVPPGPGAWMDRARYMDGREAALLCISSPDGFMPNAGFCYVMQREAILKAKYFWGGFEITQLTQVVPFGVTGFDAKAAMYWGRGQHQGNVQVDNLPFKSKHRLKLQYILLNQKERENAEVMWRLAFSSDSTKELTRVLRDREDEQTADLLAKSLSACLVSTFLRVFKVAPPSFRSLASRRWWRVLTVVFLWHLPHSLKVFVRAFVPSSLVKRVMKF